LGRRVQAVLNELVAANIVMRRGQLIRTDDPFAQEIWRKRWALMRQPAGVSSSIQLSCVLE
jgi:hypothetical protein